MIVDRGEAETAYVEAFWRTRIGYLEGMAARNIGAPGNSQGYAASIRHSADMAHLVYTHLQTHGSDQWPTS